MPTTHDNPKSPRSEAQIAAARRNGAKSRGPVTAEGKAKSARNALRHGLTAFHLALTCEDKESFNLVLNDYMDEYDPQGVTETNLVERIAFAQWQMYRGWTAETAALNVEIEMNRAKLDAKFTHFHEAVRIADAIESSLARTGSLPHIHRCLARVTREYFQSLKVLRTIRKERVESTAAEAGSALCTTQATESAPASGTCENVETNPAIPQRTGTALCAIATQSTVDAVAQPKHETAETNPAIPQQAEAARYATAAVLSIRDIVETNPAGSEERIHHSNQIPAGSPGSPLKKNTEQSASFGISILSENMRGQQPKAAHAT